MRTKRLLVLLLALTIVLGAAACGSGTATTTTAAPVATAAPPFAGQSLTVSAASSLRAVFTELATTFERRTGAKLDYNFAASGVLQKQIEGGALADVFASASAANVDALVKAELVDKATVATFAGNEIVLAVPADSILGITGFADLAKAEVKKVATGNPAAAPHGKSALEVLTSLRLLGAVKPKLIFAANASQTYDYAARDEVDAAILFFTDVNGKAAVKMVEKAPADSYKPVQYVIGVVSASTVKPLGRAFIDAVLSPEGQALFARHGFKAP